MEKKTKIDNFRKFLRIRWRIRVEGLLRRNDTSHRINRRNLNNGPTEARIYKKPAVSKVIGIKKSVKGRDYSGVPVAINALVSGKFRNNTDAIFGREKCCCEKVAGKYYRFFPLSILEIQDRGVHTHTHVILRYSSFALSFVIKSNRLHNENI